MSKIEFPFKLSAKKIFALGFNLPALQAALKFEKKLQKKVALQNIQFIIAWRHDLALPDELVHPNSSIKVEYYNSLDEFLKQHWSSEESIFLFFAAAGIIIRKIAPLLMSKYQDPPVIAADFALKYFIPLLAGHAGQAVEIAKIFSEAVASSRCILTGASDQLGLPALDVHAQKWQLQMQNNSAYPAIANAIVEKKKIFFYAPPELKNFFDRNLLAKQLNISYKNFENAQCDLQSDPRIKKNSFCFVWQKSFYANFFTLRITNIFLGIGCNRGTDVKNIEAAFFSFLQSADIDISQIKGVASIDIKQDEQGLIEFCRQHEFTLRFFSKEEINMLDGEFSKSAAQNFLEAKGVAEPCAVLLAANKTLLIKKKSYRHVTIAAAF